MDEIILLGNAAAVPMIIAITQWLKNNFATQFKRRADVISLIVSFVVCIGWWLYHTPEVEIINSLTGDWITIMKSIITMITISVATWLSSKGSYDLFLGEKKRTRKLNTHLIENKKLRKELEAVRNEYETRKKVPTSEVIDLAEKLRSILEGRN